MAVAMLSWLLAIPLLGFTTGLRSMTPMAVLSWYAWLEYLPVGGTWAGWVGRLSVAIVLTVLALGELVGDKMPRVPNRTAPLPLLFRLILGGLAGAIAATAMMGPTIEGALLGAIGAALGAFAGFMVRRDLVEKIGCKDWHVALVEDAIAILFATFSLHVITA
ncbi:MAG TPA: DUF4126 family protein [Acidobacteriaceae bacterium]